MEWALAVLGIQGVLGAYDNFRNHEFQAGLPHRQSQWRELLLHSAREGLYCVLFPTMAWLEWRGWFAGVLAAIIVAELMVTCWDFVEEDRTRTLSANERVLHTLLTLNYGAFLALFVPVLLQWGSQPTALAVVYRGPWSWLMSIYSAGVLVFGLRELLAGLKHLRQRRGAACEQLCSSTGARTFVHGLTCGDTRHIQHRSRASIARPCGRAGGSRTHRPGLAGFHGAASPRRPARPARPHLSGWGRGIVGESVRPIHLR